MKHHVILATAFSAALAVGVSAQSTGAQSGQQSPQKQAQQNQQVTVTGCLQSADIGGAAGTAGTTGQATGSSRSEARFMLTNARITAGASGTGTSGTAPTGTTGAAGTASNKFMLTGGNQQDLKQYLNSEVEIRGTLQKGAAKGSGAAGTGTGTATGQSKTDENVQTIRVASVKQTAKTCTGGDL